MTLREEHKVLIPASENTPVCYTHLGNTSDLYSRGPSFKSLHSKWLFWLKHGCAIAQVASCWPHVVEAWVQTQTSLCWMSCFSQILQFSPVSIIPPVQHIHMTFTYHWCYISLALDGTVKYDTFFFLLWGFHNFSQTLHANAMILRQITLQLLLFHILLDSLCTTYPTSQCYAVCITDRHEINNTLNEIWVTKHSTSIWSKAHSAEKMWYCLVSNSITYIAQYIIRIVKWKKFQ